MDGKLRINVMTLGDEKVLWTLSVRVCNIKAEICCNTCHIFANVRT